MGSDCFQLSMTYVQTCCYTFSASDFSKIISKNVKLSNQTNEQTPVQAMGRKLVTNLFNKFIFTNTSHVDVKKISLEKEQDNIILKLSIEENKKEEKKTNRYLFQETTIFSFKKSKDESYKISHIDMKIKRDLIKENIESH